MGVREIAWLAFRNHLCEELTAGLKFLAKWADDKDENIRRAASEGSRPRGVWCAHMGALREKPEQAIAILEPLKADPSIYVRRSVGNWLNDAAKDNAAWVRKLCKRWTKESPVKETQWIAKRALRTVGAA
jgi:3-methyladenine DNA glycosylase AlkC